MAREFGPVNVAIWSDPEWRRLPWPAQYLYLLLWTSPGLTYCGTHDWRPKRIAALASDLSIELVEAAGDCLIARHFIVVDEETDEVLVRSWARFDGLVKKPRMAVSYASAYASVASATIRQVLVHETEKMRDLWPELACWGDKRLVEVLSHESVSAKDLPSPSDPFEAGLRLVCDEFATGLPQTEVRFATDLQSPTPAPAPAPYSKAPGASSDEVGPKAKSTGRKRPAARLSDDWSPNEAHQEKATTRGLHLEHEVDTFRNHAKANDRTQVDWDASFHTWLNRSKPDPRLSQPAPYRPRPHELVKPPDGLTDAQYDEFLKDPQGFVDRWSA